MNSTESVETTDIVAEIDQLAQEHDHSGHDHTAHDHSGHNHTGQQGPSLNPELTREIEVEVPADEVSKAFKTVVKKYQRLARIPGFRAGKVPESLIRSRFAKDIRQEVLESLVSERFAAALKEQKAQPVSEPQLLDMQLFDGQPLRFKAAFEVLPEFDVSDYDSVSVTKPDAELTEDEFQAELDRALEPHATIETVEEDRGLADGDWAEIQFQGVVKPLVETVTEEGATPAEPTPPPITGEDVMIEIGGKNTLAAFNEALRGAKPGQEMSFEVVYPADFGERRLAGQTVAYDVTVKAIKSKTYPEHDDEIAKQLGNYETWSDFETKLRAITSGRKRDAVENDVKNRMLDEIVSRYSFPVPESFVQQQVDARLDRGLRALANQGMSSDDMRKLDFTRLRAAQRGDAEREVRASLVLDRIAEAESVEVSDPELDNELLMLSIQSREPLETLRTRLASDGGLDRIRSQMRREKTGTLLYDKLIAS